MINGITVPPEPSATINNATLAGVDINGNGVRDDVERKIATQFGSDKIKFNAVMVHEATLQSAITEKTADKVQAHVLSVSCLEDSLLNAVDKLEKLILNTPARQRAYAEAFIGVVLEGCKK